MQSEKNPGKKERQREQKEKARTKCQIERERKTHTAAHRERREEDGGVGQERCWGWDLPLPERGWGPGVLFTAPPGLNQEQPSQASGSQR